MKTRKVVRIDRRGVDLAERLALLGRARRQKECYELLEASGGALELVELRGRGGFSPSVIAGLQDKGLVVVEEPTAATGQGAQATSASGDSDEESGPPRILVLEDDESVQLLVSHALREIDAEVTIVSSVSSAWRFLESQPVQAVVLDLFLPDGDGR